MMAQDNNTPNGNNNTNNNANKPKHNNNKRYGYNSKTYQQRPPRENHPQQPQAVPQGSSERKPESAGTKMQPENVGNDPSGNPYNRKNNFRGGRKEKQNIKLEETVDDIRNDLKRIEKEIELEIKEINALKLGL